MPGGQAEVKADLPRPALMFTKTRPQPAFVEPLKEELGSLQRATTVVAVRLPKASVAIACDTPQAKVKICIALIAEFVKPTCDTK